MTELKKPEGMLFDLGDTILGEMVFDFPKSAKHLLTMAENPNGVTVEEMVAVANELLAEILPRCEETLLEFSNLNFQRLLFDRLGLTFNLTPLEIELEIWKSGNSLKPEPGIIDVIDFLEQNSIRMGIVSNSLSTEEVLRWELRRHNLDRFMFVISSAEYGFRKPHFSIMKAAISRLGIAPENTWFVGDLIKYDVRGALDSGMTAVWYNRKQQPPEEPKPHLEVKSWPEFLNILEILQRQK